MATLSQKLQIYIQECTFLINTATTSDKPILGSELDLSNMKLAYSIKNHLVDARMDNIHCLNEWYNRRSLVSSIFNRDDVFKTHSIKNIRAAAATAIAKTQQDLMKPYLFLDNYEIVLQWNKLHPDNIKTIAPRFCKTPIEAPTGHTIAIHGTWVPDPIEQYRTPVDTTFVKAGFDPLIAATWKTLSSAEQDIAHSIYGWHRQHIQTMGYIFDDARIVAEEPWITYLALSEQNAIVDIENAAVALNVYALSNASTVTDEKNHEITKINDDKKRVLMKTACHQIYGKHFYADISGLIANNEFNAIRLLFKERYGTLDPSQSAVIIQEVQQALISSPHTYAKCTSVTSTLGVFETVSVILTRLLESKLNVNQANRHTGPEQIKRGLYLDEADFATAFPEVTRVISYNDNRARILVPFNSSTTYNHLAHKWSSIKQNVPISDIKRDLLITESFNSTRTPQSALTMAFQTTVLPDAFIAPLLHDMEATSTSSASGIQVDDNDYDDDFDHPIACATTSTSPVNPAIFEAPAPCPLCNKCIKHLTIKNAAHKHTISTCPILIKIARLDDNELTALHYPTAASANLPPYSNLLKARGISINNKKRTSTGSSKYPTSNSGLGYRPTANSVHASTSSSSSSFDVPPHLEQGFDPSRI